MYLLFLDESGTHQNAPVFVLAGLAIHEHDAWHMQQRLEGSLTYRLAPLGLDARQFELHAKDIKAADKEWSAVPVRVRFQVLGGTYRSLATFGCINSEFPCALFGAVVDGRYGDREERAYELVLNKFDEMLYRIHKLRRSRETGLVIHDKKVTDSPIRTQPPKNWNEERRIQQWTQDWREVAGKVGKLHHMADVPLFVDSRATRLVQAADFVCWALWRFYARKDRRWANDLWSQFDAADGAMHGLIHVTPTHWKAQCECPPCANRRQV